LHPQDALIYFFQNIDSILSLTFDEIINYSQSVLKHVKTKNLKDKI